MNTPSKMEKSNTSDPANGRGTSTPIFEPFPEPRAYPSGWDLSGFESPSSLPTAQPAGDEAEA